MTKVNREAKIGNLQQLGVACEIKAAHLVPSVSPETRKSEMLSFFVLFIAVVSLNFPCF